MDYQKLDEMLESIDGTRRDSPKAYQTEKTGEHSSEWDRDCFLHFCKTYCSCDSDPCNCEGNPCYGW